MLALYAYPFVSSIYRSFLVKGEGAVTLANYAKARQLYLRDILFSLEVSLLSTTIAAVLSIALAAYLRMATGRIAKMVGAVYRLPIFIPFVVVAQMMNTFLAPHGLLNVFLAQLHLIDLKAPLQLFNWKGLTFSFVWKQAAFMTLIVLSGFKMIDDSYIEAARSLGARLPRVIVSILIPMSLASISVAVILAFTSIMGTFTLPYMIIAGEPTTVTVDIAHRVTYFGDYGVANALGTITYLMVSFAAIYYLRYTVRKSIYEVQEG
ncbi:MAG: ABC transporter permease subunit [Anaerolineae bacterium]|jgi:ABC-type spermidine/putrescine transport system permease subunit I|nr:ABC transporter permease subunit [Anaerolineae bacterium]MDH7474054.1 ABC transporter permease subunit [Anaerolineae bacterium]